jgi:hypothetical protein
MASNRWLITNEKLLLFQIKRPQPILKHYPSIFLEGAEDNYNISQSKQRFFELKFETGV